MILLLLAIVSAFIGYQYRAISHPAASEYCSCLRCRGIYRDGGKPMPVSHGYCEVCAPKAKEEAVQQVAALKNRSAP